MRLKCLLGLCEMNLEDRGSLMWHKRDHTASREKSPKQTSPEPRSCFDFGETNFPTPKCGCKPGNQSHEVKSSDKKTPLALSN